MKIRAIIKSTAILKAIFHLVFKPAFAMLPERRRNQMMTIAHHVKMTLVYGHVMQFGKTVVIAEKSASVPSWVVDEMRSLAAIEPDLLPTPEYLAQFHAYRNELNAQPGRVFSVCRKIIGDVSPDVIILAPWLKRGGADLGVLHHIDACRNRGVRPLLITTLDAESPWLQRVPKDVPVVELGRLGCELTEAQRLLVLIRLILQTNAGAIHIINSRLGWEMLKLHGKSLKAVGKSVFASLYCDDYDSLGRDQSYGKHYLPSTLDYLSGIICDNAYYPKELNRRYGVDINKMHTVYFPTEQTHEPKYISAEQGRVLWAGRIAQQKRPDILLAIASAMPDVQFHVKGYASSHDEKQIEKKLTQLPNVTFTGPYDNGELVQGGPFSLFLYTSEWDGLPNILLEATVAGLPIVTSAVGGVPELINEETGYPVRQPESINDYIRLIRHALNNREERRERWEKAVRLVQARHSKAPFFMQMGEINGYFGNTSAVILDKPINLSSCHFNPTLC